MTVKNVRFINLINEELQPHAYIAYNRNNKVFQVTIRKNKYFNSAIFNVNDEYFVMIKKIAMDVFDKKVNFNNTGHIFWI